MPAQDFSYPSQDGGSVHSVPISILADDPATRRQLCSDAEIAGFYPVSGASLVDALYEPHQALANCVLLHCGELGPLDCAALLDLDRRMRESGTAVIASVVPAALDDVFACIDQSHPEILVAPSRGDRLVALGRVMASRTSNRVQEGAASEDVLRQLTEQVGQLAAQLDRLTGGDRPVFRLESPTDDFRGADEAERRLIRSPRPPLPDPRLIRRIIAQRRARDKFFGPDLFADPAWDILLDLTAARAEHSRVSVTSLCIASGVPPTTGLRWISQMIEAGLLERIEDESDRRRAFIQLSDRAAEAMARYFAELGKDGKLLV
ncbi:winged helix DNA-binding protein [Parafrankia sp. BMG5.11]|uniref:winged helix DNA-binding protein n=1 Tax=Parafrankia sp. BMG5.11 TaxID=222540 RepID=UPI001038C2B1|nr:winged helix DNA-binding protein [Parafrankia sp. BMG5.11]TCJ38255.1 MarR family transcriptional regulator [Parafrankia sp. BMG5.11]